VGRTFVFTGGTVVTFSRRIRRVLSPSQNIETDSLDEVRRHTREILNKPYQYQPQAAVSSEVVDSRDPFEGLFKPFSKVAAPAVVFLTQKVEARTFNQWGLVRALGIFLLILAAYLIYQAWTSVYTSGGLISPIPGNTATATNTSTLPPSSIPAGVQLQQGGPYNSSSGQPSSGLNQSSSAPLPTNIGPVGGPSAGNGVVGGTGGTPTPTTTTCPSDKVCSGSDIAGQPCSQSYPCTPVSVGGVVVTVNQYMSNTAPPCPCILTHM